jgi:hypothetical protein
VAATAATAAAAAAATTAAAAAAAATTAAAAAAAASGALLGFVDAQGASVELGTVHGLHGAIGFGLRAHRHEAEASRLPSGAIGYDVNVDDLTVLSEGVAERVLRRMKRQITDVQTISHVHSQSARKFLPSVEQ